MADEAKEIRRLRKARQRELQRAMQRRRQTRGQAGEAPPMQAAEEALHLFYGPDHHAWYES